MSVRSEVGLKIQFKSVEQRDSLIQKFHDGDSAYDAEVLFEQFKEDDIDGYGKLLLNDSDASIIYDNADVRWYGSHFIIAVENFIQFAKKAADSLEFPNSGGYVIITDEIETDYWTSIGRVPDLACVGLDYPLTIIWPKSFFEWS